MITLKTHDRLQECLRSEYHFGLAEQHPQPKLPECVVCERAVFRRYHPKGARIAPNTFLA